jgi:two-component system invasion response regulator UvrY
MEAMTRIRATAPSVRILIFTGYPAARYAKRLLQQGASGYLDKSCAPEELLSAVRSVAAKSALDEAKAAAVCLPARTQRGVAPHETLSRREFQIFLRLAKGLSVGAIATLISVSPVTVSTYRRRLSKKMGLATGSEFMRYALAHGLLT